MASGKFLRSSKKTSTLVHLYPTAKSTAALNTLAASLPHESADAEELDKFKQKLNQILIESLKHWMKIRGVPESESKTDFIASQTTQEEADARAKT